MQAGHPAGWADADLLAECSVQRLRRSGPGGQHRNKVETAVRMRHLPTQVTVEASERRSQKENGKVALARLRVQLALSIRQPAADAPSQSWQSRLQGRRISVSRQHVEFPGLLAEALDVLHGFDFDLSHAASRLGCSNSQLIRFLKLEPQALARVNSERAQRGLRMLR